MQEREPMHNENDSLPIVGQFMAGYFNECSLKGFFLKHFN